MRTETSETLKALADQGSEMPTPPPPFVFSREHARRAEQAEVALIKDLFEEDIEADECADSHSQSSGKGDADHACSIFCGDYKPQLSRGRLIGHVVRDLRIRLHYHVVITE